LELWGRLSLELSRQILSFPNALFSFYGDALQTNNRVRPLLTADGIVKL
jgi:hypothetical protein